MCLLFGQLSTALTEIAMCQPKRTLPALIALLSALFLALPLAALNRPDSPDGAETVASEPSSEDLPPLPVQLSLAQLSAPNLTPVRAACPCRPRLRAGFFRGLYGHPLTPRQVAMRNAVYDLAVRPKQYVRVRLVDGTVLTGKVSSVNAQGFFLAKGNATLGPFRMISISYRQLAEPPRPVAAVGTHIVHGLQTAGAVALCVVLVPVALPLIFTGVLND
jgi:hypothetical protein